MSDIKDLKEKEQQTFEPESVKLKKRKGRKRSTFFAFSLIFIGLFAFGIMNLNGCSRIGSIRGSGNVISEGREVDDFDRIHLDGVGEILITQGDTEGLVIEAEDNIMTLIETGVRGDTLEIGMQSGRSIIPTKDLKFYVTVLDLEGLSIDGLGSITAEDLVIDSLEIEIDGSGNITINNLEADSITTEMNGLGSVTIRGTVEDQEIEIDGAGSYNGRDLNSESTEINLNGLGSVSVAVEDELEVDIDGAGSVTYSGNPRVDSDIDGIGRVTKQ